MLVVRGASRPRDLGLLVMGRVGEGIKRGSTSQIVPPVERVGDLASATPPGSGLLGVA